jgi:hypothetical protein
VRGQRQISLLKGCILKDTWSKQTANHFTENKEVIEIKEV